MRPNSKQCAIIKKKTKLSGYTPAHMHINSVAHLTYSTEDTFNVAFNNEPKLPLLQD